MITKEIIQLCNDGAKVVVTASEMLASMRRNVTPTRAEVSDVANAVLDGTDAVVLSEEVANGKYGAQAVQVMQRIIDDIEERAHVRPNWTKHTPRVENEMDSIAYHAYRTAERVKAKAIVTITKAGNTALKLASYRAPVPVIAVTFSEYAQRRLSIVRGVDTLLLDIDPNIDEVLPLVNDQLVRSSWLKAGDPIVFVAITLSPVGRESSNLFTVQILS
jgi:pyruvate kinase